LRIEDYKSVLSCVEGSLPLRYLELPAHDKSPRNSERKLQKKEKEKKLGTWQYSTYGGRVFSLKSCPPPSFVKFHVNDINCFMKRFSVYTCLFKKIG
jgi:hypothetical protein